MRVKQIWTAATGKLNLTTAEVARMLNVSAQSLGQKVSVLETIKANDFFRILDTIGIDTCFYVRKTGELLVNEQKHGRRVTGMSDHVIYDTDDAHILASSFYADGEHEFGEDGRAQELYVDREGRYFVAEYSNKEDEPDRVRSAPANMATAFIKQYGLPVVPV